MGYTAPYAQIKSTRQCAQVCMPPRTALDQLSHLSPISVRPQSLLTNGGGVGEEAVRPRGLTGNSRGLDKWDLGTWGAGNR